MNDEKREPPITMPSVSIQYDNFERWDEDRSIEAMLEKTSVSFETWKAATTWLWSYTVQPALDALVEREREAEAQAFSRALGVVETFREDDMSYWENAPSTFVTAISDALKADDGLSPFDRLRADHERTVALLKKAATEIDELEEEIETMNKAAASQVGNTADAIAEAASQLLVALPKSERADAGVELMQMIQGGIHRGIGKDA